MQIISVRRVILIGLSITLLLSAFVSFNILRFDSESWLKSQTEASDLANLHLPTPLKQGTFNTKLVWNNLSLELDDESYFETEQLSVQLNSLSILLGQPQIESITLKAPYLETSKSAVTVQQLRIPVALGIKELSIVDALVVIGPTELHEVQVGMIKNGSFGEYSMQTSGYIRQDVLDISFGYSAQLSIDGDKNIRLSNNTLESRLNLDQSTGRLVGKIKSLSLAPNNDLSMSFVSWSSQWQQSLHQAIPSEFDFAGGLEAGNFKAAQWNLTMLDAALAFRDTDNIGHTYTLQSTQANTLNESVTGQLSVSILTEKPEAVNTVDDWQSYNLVMSGAINNNQPLLSWSLPEFRLAFINGNNERISHNIALRTIDIDPTAQHWLMDDGDWNQFLNDTNTAGYGFGKITGQWPSMKILEGPAVAQNLQYALNLLSSDLVTLNALFRHLVQ
ncbi:hypothetical protein [Reinekea sp.]|uniref:hypothetical protein n=1 Tax=Reinekea sp. TaxID=1970455 RepID=UPI00398A129E